MLSGKPWEDEDEDGGDGAMPVPVSPVSPVSDTSLSRGPADWRGQYAASAPPDTLAHKAERLTDAALDAALASALAGDFAAAELRLARVSPPCILHPGNPRPKTHRLPGHHYTRRGAGLQAKKVSPWRR